MLATLLASDHYIRRCLIGKVEQSIVSVNANVKTIDLNSNEVPVCDGSSIMFVKKLQELGYEEQSEFKDFFRIKKMQIFTASISFEGKTLSISSFLRTAKELDPGPLEALMISSARHSAMDFMFLKADSRDPLQRR